MPDICGRDYDTIRMQSCADCECDLLGMSEWSWWNLLPKASKDQLPPITFVHVAERPYCEACRQGDEPAVYIGPDEYLPYNTGS
jgi:hypothetical protein